MNGIILVNKPMNWTSRDVVNKISHIYHTKKVGHTGTLDPLATGVLVICIGTYTKLADMLTAHEKEYIATMKLGIKTDTGDITGNVLEKKEAIFSKETIEQAFKNFPEKYNQKVPIYSAVKVNGKKLYEYAREKKEVEIPFREVQIKNLEILNMQEEEITFQASVSKGTYIRSLINDLAESFGTIATMSQLVRTKVGHFQLEYCKNIDEITEETTLLTIDDIFSYPKIEVEEKVLKQVQNGNILQINSNHKRIMITNKNKTIAIYEKADTNYKLLFRAI